MLNTVLQKMGFNPTSQTSKNTTYRSPFNPTEQTPSFFTFQGRNGINWKDYASGEGGDVYKFLMLFHKISFPEAKKILEDLGEIEVSQVNSPKLQNNSHSSFNQQEKSYKILKMQELQNKALVKYLDLRGITSPTNVNEVYYELKGKRYFAIGFINNSGGLEIRNEYFKGAFGKKDITTIAPTKEKYSLKVFEGFIDYLSYLQLATTPTKSDYLILNSVSMIDKAKSVLNGKYSLIELYLDNDKAGNEATIKIQQLVAGVKIIDKRSFYQENKDLNDYLLHKKNA